jgi:peptide deformylase
MSQVLCTKFHNYPELKGISGANVGIPFNIIGFKNEHNVPVFMINPKIIHKSDETRIIDSNCGSLLLDRPVKVKRASGIKVEFRDAAGNNKTEFFKNRVAATIQHEIDHNKGITILDRAKELRLEEE